MCCLPVSSDGAVCARRRLPTGLEERPEAEGLIIGDPSRRRRPRNSGAGLCMLGPGKGCCRCSRGNLGLAGERQGLAGRCRARGWFIDGGLSLDERRRNNGRLGGVEHDGARPFVGGMNPDGRTIDVSLRRHRWRFAADTSRSGRGSASRAPPTKRKYRRSGMDYTSLCPPPGAERTGSRTNRSCGRPNLVTLTCVRAGNWPRLTVGKKW